MNQLFNLYNFQEFNHNAQICKKYELLDADTRKKFINIGKLKTNGKQSEDFTPEQHKIMNSIILQFLKVIKGSYSCDGGIDCRTCERNIYNKKIYARD